MEQFIVSARKYRPNSFESLVGQENIAATLKNSIIRGQLAHAYLFCGPRGVGKTSTARIFAKSINCLNPSKDMEPCGKCESCLSFTEGRSYCIHELDAASNNSVDDIRNLTEMVRIPPQIGKYSVYIIDEVHMLSSAAFNAFLKTLEEPPAHAIFILATTEKHKILPTILSRCQTYDFNRISVRDMVDNLTEIAKKEGVSIDSDTLHILAIKADGAMRDALTLFDQTVAFCGKNVKYEEVIKNLNVLDYEYYFKMVDNSLSGDYISSLMLFDEILSKGFNALHFISGLSSHLRDLIVCKNNSAEYLLSLPPNLIERYREQASRCSIGFIYSSLSVTTTCESQYRQSGNQRLLIEFTLMKLALGATATVTQPVTAASTAQRSAAPPAASVAVSPAQNAIPSVQPTITVAQPAATAPVQPTPPLVTAPPTPQPATQPTPSAISPPESAPASSSTNKTGTPTEAPPSVPGLSIKDLLRSANDSDKSKTKGNEQEATPFSGERFMEVWRAFAESEKAAGRTVLGNTLLQYAPTIDVPNAKVVFYVSNAAQVSWVKEKCLLRIIAHIRKEMNNGRVDLNVDVAPVLQNDTSRKLYMPEEKAKFIMEKSEELRELKKDLDLEIK